MAYVKEWLPELKYPGSAIQAGDEIYLKCYVGGNAGYVSMYDDHSPGWETLVSMLGSSYVDKNEGTHVYWATWVPSTERKTEAITFTVKKGVGRTWLQACKKGGGSQAPRELVCVAGAQWVQFDSTSNKTLPWLQFSGVGHVGFAAKTDQVGLYATSSGGRWYLNTAKVGVECVFVPEKVVEGDVNYSKPFSA